MSRRQVRRERRRTERTLDEAFAALDRGEIDLALRVGRRAREAGGMNPRVQLAFAELAMACGEAAEAEDVLRVLLVTTPTFAAAHALLATLLWRAGRRPAALRAQARVVELEPRDALAAERLAEWRAALPEAVTAAPDPTAPASPPVSPRWSAQDVDSRAAAMIEAGAAVLPRLLAVDECDRLRAAYCAEAAEFDREDRPAGAVGEPRGRHFLELPPWLAELREAAYEFAVAVAAQLHVVLLGARGGAPARPDPVDPGAPWPGSELPTTWRAWRQRELQFAGSRPMLRVLRLGPGDRVTGPEFVDPRAFPWRLVVDLGPAGAAAPAQPTLVLADHRPGRKVRERTAPTRPGDAVLFSSRRRLDRIAGVYGLQIVRWSFGPFPAERWLLDIPFDDG